MPLTAANDGSSSEEQRQYVRVRLPAKVEINQETFYVKDLSAGGIGIHDITKPYKSGEEIALLLTLPFPDFSLDIRLLAQIQYYDKKSKLTGCRFVNLTPGQVSTLNLIVQTYSSGDTVNAEEIFQAASGESFVTVRGGKDRKKKDGDNTQVAFVAGGIVLFLFSLTILAAGFENFSAFTTKNAYVDAHIFNMRAPDSGTLNLLIKPNANSIKKDQLVARITNKKKDIVLTDRVLLSPCNCSIQERFASDQEFLSVGEPIVTLLPEENKLYVTATLTMEETHRIRIGMNTKITIAGLNKPIEGIVSDIKRSKDDINKGIVKIAPQSPIPDEYLNRPASVKFYKR